MMRAAEIFDHEAKRALRAWLRETATRKGLSHSDVAWMVSRYRRTNPKTIEKYFLGERSPAYPVLVALVQALGELPPPLRVGDVQIDVPELDPLASYDLPS